MSTIVAKLYGADTAERMPASRAADRHDENAGGWLDAISSRIRTYFRNQSELRIEQMIVDSGGKLTDSIEREITRRLERGY